MSLFPHPPDFPTILLILCPLIQIEDPSMDYEAKKEGLGAWHPPRDHAIADRDWK